MTKLTAFKFYCICGSAWKGKVEPIMFAKLKEQWDEIHQGEGHAPTDARTAARARGIAEEEFFQDTYRERNA